MIVFWTLALAKGLVTLGTAHTFFGKYARCFNYVDALDSVCGGRMHCSDEVVGGGGGGGENPKSGGGPGGG